jgi:hypothetical protein
MQGLRPYVQDENAMAALHHRPLAVKGGGGGGENAGLGASARKGGATPGFPGARKALGNITNARGFDAENAAPPGKTPSARRALGDITNSSTTAQKLGQQQGGKAPMTDKQQPLASLRQQQQQQQPVTAAVAAPSGRAEAYAESGVERLAGHSWQQLERGRLAREDAEIDSRLAALASFPGRSLPSFFPHWVRSRCLQQQPPMCPTLCVLAGLPQVDVPSIPAFPTA